MCVRVFFPIREASLTGQLAGWLHGCMINILKMIFSLSLLLRIFVDIFRKLVWCGHYERLMVELADRSRIVAC